MTLDLEEGLAAFLSQETFDFVWNCRTALQEGIVAKGEKELGLRLKSYFNEIVNMSNIALKFNSNIILLKQYILEKTVRNAGVLQS